MLGFAAQLIVNQRQQFVSDRTRSQINQTLRAGMDLVGNDIRQAGEHVNDNLVPVVSVADNTAPSRGQTLVVQRKLTPTQLFLCQPIAAPGDRLVVKATRTCTQPSSAAPTEFVKWKNFRCNQDEDINTDDLTDPKNQPCNRNGLLGAANACEQNGGADQECVWAYIHDPVLNRGDFFLTDAEGLNGTTNFLHRLDGSGWSHPNGYTAINLNTPPSIYVFEERQYRLIEDTQTARGDDYALEMTVNRQPNKQRLLSSLSDFQVEVQLQAGSAIVPFNFVGSIPTYVTNWRPIQQMKVMFAAVNYPETPYNQAVPGGVKVPNDNLTLESQFFPRNSLSNPALPTP